MATGIGPKARAFRRRLAELQLPEPVGRESWPRALLAVARQRSPRSPRSYCFRADGNPNDRPQEAWYPVDWQRCRAGQRPEQLRWWAAYYEHEDRGGNVGPLPGDRPEWPGFILQYHARRLHRRLQCRRHRC